MPKIKKIRQITRKRKNRNLAIPAAATATPVNPKTAATSAIIKKIKAQRNIFSPPSEKNRINQLLRAFFSPDKSEDIAKYVFLKGKSYEHNSINYSHSSANWSAACLAVQSRLGLLSQRRTRLDSYNSNNPGAVGRHLSRSAGCGAERIRVSAPGKNQRDL
jgi:hypothetical protein